MSHGSKSHRQPGSIGASATPSRVFPGKKMPGHLGDERIKIRQLEVFPLSQASLPVQACISAEQAQLAFPCFLRSSCLGCCCTRAQPPWSVSSPVERPVAGCVFMAAQ